VPNTEGNDKYRLEDRSGTDAPDGEPPIPKLL
jgi:hypothetical protein